MEDKKISYLDLESLRKATKDIIENVKRKSEKDIVQELQNLGYKIEKQPTADELLKQADELKNKSDEIKKEAVKQFSSQPKPQNIDLNTLRGYTKKIDESSDILKKVRDNEALVFKTR